MMNLKDVTVFIISSGNNPCFDLCIKALENQTATFNLQIIKDVYPMSKAFQLMIDSCKTKYYIEVDEDMILYNTAIKTMYDKIKFCDEKSCNERNVYVEKTAIVAYKLLDIHLNFEIFGVKIYNHNILKLFPYDLSSMSCEVEQIDRLKAKNYEIKLVETVIGDHAPLWNDNDIFYRYNNLMDKYKQFNYPWLQKLPSMLFSTFKNNPTEQNLFAILGAYTSIINDNMQIGEKDFRHRQVPLEKMKPFLQGAKSANLYLTTKCNFNCKFCYRNSGLIEKSPDLSLEKVKDLLLKFPDIKGVCCAGYGEPFLHDGLFSIINYLKQNKKTVGLITNGSLLLDRFQELQLNRPDYISISINAPTTQIYSELNGSPLETFDKVLTGIKKCVDSGLPTYCSYVCTKDNLKYIPETLKLLNSLGVQTVHLLNLLPHLAQSYNDESFWNEVLTLENQKDIDSIKQLPEASIVKLYPTLINRGEIRRNCSMPWTTIGINGNGNVTFCGSVYAPNKNNGTMYDNDIWHNRYVTNLRNSLCNELNDTCKMCFRNWVNTPVDVKYNVLTNNVEKTVIVKSSTDFKKLNISKIIDQFGWAYYFVAKDQQKYSKHNIEYLRYHDIIANNNDKLNNLKSDIVYIHSPDIATQRINTVVVPTLINKTKIIGAYGGESTVKYNYADLIVSISIKHLSFLRALYPKKTVVFLPECVDTDYFIPFEKNNDDFNVGWAGRPKNAVKRAYLLDSLKFNIIRQSEWGPEFFIDGRTLDSMLEFYQSIDALVITSSSECMPRVVLEAMACGLPIVATDVGCISLLLEKDWIVPTFPEQTTIIEMNRKLELLSSNKSLRKQVGHRNREFIEKYFSWAKNQILWDDTFNYVMTNDYESIKQLSNNFLQSIPSYSVSMEQSQTNIQLQYKDLQETNQKQYDDQSILDKRKLQRNNRMQNIVPIKKPVIDIAPQNVITEELVNSPSIEPIMISYYTKNTSYEIEYKNLEASLKQFNLKYDIQGIDTKGSWFNNCFYRSIFVRDMLTKHKQPVVWVDCDAIIRSKPKLLWKLSNYDFACYFKPRPNGTRELLGGTMYFNNTENAIKLLDAWIQCVNEHKISSKLDQSYLQTAVQLVSNIKVYELPPTYCQIFDLMKDVGTPVIEHFQASRRFKHEVQPPKIQLTPFQRQMQHQARLYQ